MGKATELKKAFEWGKKNDSYNLDFPDVDWLIEQAEKVERLENEVKFHKGYCLRFSDKIKELEEENKELTIEKNTLQIINENLIQKTNRYEDALQFYANKKHYEVCEEVDKYLHLVDMDEGDKARRALEEE